MRQLLEPDGGELDGRDPGLEGSHCGVDLLLHLSELLLSVGQLGPDRSQLAGQRRHSLSQFDDLTRRSGLEDHTVDHDGSDVQLAVDLDVTVEEPGELAACGVHTDPFGAFGRPDHAR